MARKQLNSKQENNAQTEVETAEEMPVSATLMPPRPKMESPEAAECAGESSLEIDAVPQTETGEEEGKAEFSDTGDSDGAVPQTSH